MRSISQVVNATPFNTDKETMKLFRVIGSVDMDGQGVQHEITQIDPFIFLDDALIAGELSASFNKHPHTGLTAVTYLLEGTVHAWDNIHGATPDLNHAGGVYCVDAGSGIVHGEAPIEGTRKVRLLQMWYNPGIYDLPLPQANYQLFQPEQLPVFKDDRLWAKIIIGTGFNLNSPVVSRWPIQYLHIKLAPHQSYLLKMLNLAWQGFIYVIHGKGSFGKDAIKALPQQCLILGSESSDTIQVKNTDETPLEFILATGQPHHKPFVKLLGHGGAIVADTEKNARAFMKAYEMNPENFGRV